MNISQHIKHSVNYFLNSFTFSSTLLSDSPRSVGSGPFYGPFRRDELEWGKLPHFEDLPAGFGTARPQKRWDVAFQTSSCKFQVNFHCQIQVYLEVDVYSVFLGFFILILNDNENRLENCLLISQTNLHEYHQYTLSLKVKNAD